MARQAVRRSQARQAVLQHELDALRGSEPRGLISRITGRRRTWERRYALVEGYHRQAVEEWVRARNRRDAVKQVIEREERLGQVLHEIAERDRERDRQLIEEARRILAARPEIAVGRDGLSHLLAEAEGALQNPYATSTDKYGHLSDADGHHPLSCHP